MLPAKITETRRHGRPPRAANAGTVLRPPLSDPERRNRASAGEGRPR